MFDNKWQKKEMPLVSLIGMGGGIASPAFLASIVLNILKPTVFSPVDDTGVPDFDYTAESSAITNVGVVPGGDSLPAPEDNFWRSVSYGDGKFVAISMNGTNQVMYSSDGINWTETAAASGSWRSITYGNGKFVAVGRSGTNRAMYSSDGINWSAASVPEENSFDEVTYGNGKFVAIAYNGTNRVMYSSDGINWSSASAAQNIEWYSVAYGNGKFVAVGGTGTNRVMYSSDGINWSSGVPAEDATWMSITYGNGIFVAVAQSGTNRVMYSSDGENWSSASAAEDNQWQSVTYGNGIFVAVAQNGTNRVMYSSDGENWASASAEDNQWQSVTYGGDKFVAVAYYGPNHIMYSYNGTVWSGNLTELTLTDTTVLKVLDGSLVEGESIDQVLTVGETVQADTAIASTAAASVFSTTLYNGNGQSRDLDTGIDNTDKSLIWFKNRDYDYPHILVDTERGADSRLTSSNTQQAHSSGDVTSFTDSGVSLDNSTGWVNHASGHQMVAWNFRAAPGFFDIVKWNASDLTTGDYMINHNLGTTPGMIICKNIDNGGANWYVYHKDATSSSSSDPNAHFLYLNGTSKAVWSSGMSDPNSDFGGWAVTDTQFRASGSMGLDNGSDDFIAYVFAEDTPGLIKCGSYTGNGQSVSNTTEINCGFKPQFLMVKSTNITEGDNASWCIFDSQRGYNINGTFYSNQVLHPNIDQDDSYKSGNSTGYSQGIGHGIEFTDNGFICKDNAYLFNDGAYPTDYIFVAIAENAEADITSDIYASGTVSASTGNTITLSNTTGTWSTGMKVQGATTDTKDNPDPIKVENVSLTSSAPTAEKNVSTWGDAVWEIATDENFTQNVQTATTTLSATGTQAGPSFTFEPETGYYARTKYTALGQESEWSDVTYFVTRALYVDSFWINTFNHNGWNYEYTEGLDSDDNGNVYVISIRYSAGGSGYKGMSLVKLDANGDIQWQKYLTYNIPGDRTYPLESRTVSVTPDGSEIFVTAQGDLGMLVCKFNSDGALQWTKKLGGANANNFSYGTTLTSSGELVMFGRDYPEEHTFVTQISNTGSQTFYSSIGRTSGDTTQLAYECEPFADSDDNIHFVINSWNGSKRTPGVVKYNSSGVLQSVSDFNSSVDNSIADDDHFGDIAVDGSGNKYITYRRDVSGMRSGLLKLNSSDEIQWQSEISSSNPHYPLQVNIDSSGNIISGFLDTRQPNKGIIVTKHTSDGTLVWKRLFRHANTEIWAGAEVRINRNDNILINSFIQGDVKTIVCQLPSTGDLTGTYGNFIWEDATDVTVSSSTAYFKNGSSIYSAKSTSMSMSSFSDTTTGDNILTVNKTDIPTP